MSVLSAKARGWGDPGGPLRKKIAAVFERTNIITISEGGIRIRCNRGIAPLLRAAIHECTARGYRFDKVADDWGYANRLIRGSLTTLSNHAWGLACDLNATKNPMTEDGRNHTDMPAWVVAVFTRYGFSWGGNYAGRRRDPMHFEFLGTPATAAQLVKILQLPVAA